MFWKRRVRERGPDEDIGAGTGSKLARVRIFTADATVDGWVDLAGQRLSDVLNGEELLSVSHKSDPTDHDWQAFERDELLLVVPPPISADPRLRRHRVKRRLVAKSGHYIVRGLVHMIAGIELDPFLARSRQHFLPITEAWITSSHRPEVAEEHPSLLINVRSTSQPLKLEVVE